MTYRIIAGVFAFFNLMIKAITVGMEEIKERKAARTVMIQGLTEKTVIVSLRIVIVRGIILIIKVMMAMMV
jgi:hypothetical protein